MTSLVQISANASQKEVTANENFGACSPGGMFGKKYTTTTLSGGLTFGFYGGTYLVDGTLTVVSDGTISLISNATNYVQMNRTGTVTATTGGFQPGFIPLHEILTTTQSLISSYTDRRVWGQPPSQVFTSISSVSMTSSSYTLAAAEWRNDIVWLVGSGGAAIVPTVKKQYGFVNGTGAATLVKTSAGSGISIAASRAATLFCDGTHVVRLTADSTYTT